MKRPRSSSNQATIRRLLLHLSLWKWVAQEANDKALEYITYLRTTHPNLSLETVLSRARTRQNREKTQ